MHWPKQPALRRPEPPQVEIAAPSAAWFRLPASVSPALECGFRNFLSVAGSRRVFAQVPGRPRQKQPAARRKRQPAPSSARFFLTWRLPFRVLNGPSLGRGVAAGTGYLGIWVTVRFAVDGTTK